MNLVNLLILVNLVVLVNLVNLGQGGVSGY